MIIQIPEGVKVIRYNGKRWNWVKEGISAISNGDVIHVFHSDWKVITDKINGFGERYISSSIMFRSVSGNKLDCHILEEDPYYHSPCFDDTGNVIIAKY